VSVPVAPRSSLRGGTITATLSLVGIVYGLSEADTKGWTSPLTLRFIAGGVILVAVFVLIEQRSSYPLLLLRVITHPRRLLPGHRTQP
jgi:hypothetical protein